MIVYNRNHTNILASYTDTIEKLFVSFEISLIPATEKDIDYIYDVEMYNVDDTEENREIILQDAKESVGHTKLITKNEDIIGLVMLDTEEDSEGYVYLGELFVDEEYRGMHIGSTILENLTDRYPKIILRVAYSNPKAKKLYERYGFHTIRNDDSSETFIMTYESE